MIDYFKKNKVLCIVLLVVVIGVIISVAVGTSKGNKNKKTTTTTQSSTSSSSSSSSTPSSSSSSSTPSSSSSSSTQSSSSSSSSKSTGTDSENYDGTLHNDGNPVIVAKSIDLYDEVMDAMRYNDTDAYYQMYWDGKFIAVEDGQKVKYLTSEKATYAHVKIATGDFKGYEGYCKFEYFKLREK